MADITGTFNGYKLKSIVHGGRVISLAKNNYYYIPHTNRVVTYKGTRAKEMIPSKGCYNFQEKLEPKGNWPFKPNVSDLHQEAFNIFRG
jgi:hypothetical protein